MATITTRLMINGTAVTSDPIGIDYTQTPTVEAPAIESASIDVPPAGVAILTTPATATTTYLYVKNTGAVGQSYINIQFNCGSGEAGAMVATTYMRLELGDFCYLPVAASQTVTLDVPAAPATGLAEYGYFTLA